MINFEEIEKRLDYFLENLTKESWEQWLIEREYKKLYNILGEKSFSSMPNINQKCEITFNKNKFSESQNKNTSKENYILAA